MPLLCGAMEPYYVHVCVYQGDEVTNGKRKLIKTKFYTSSHLQAKRIWRNATEQHAFFQYVLIIYILSTGVGDGLSKGATAMTHTKTSILTFISLQTCFPNFLFNQKSRGATAPLAPLLPTHRLRLRCIPSSNGS